MEIFKNYLPNFQKFLYSLLIIITFPVNTNVASDSVLYV